MSGNQELVGRYTDVEGTRTYYESIGPADGFPVVCNEIHVTQV